MKPNISELVEGVDELISFPEVHVRVNQMIDDPDCSVNALSEVISHDPGLTAKILRLANSAFYGLSKEVDTVARAVSIIGMQRLRYMVLAASSVKAFDGMPNALFSLDDFWLHSIYCALSAKSLAEEVPGLQSDVLFVAGQLHDIGQLLLYSRLPELARKVVMRSIEETEEPDLYLCEREVIGFDHAQLGGALAKHWQWPTMLVETIALHHEPEKAKEFTKETAVVHIANSIAVMAELNTSHADETDAPRIHASAWAATGLTEDVIAPTIESIRGQFEQVRTLLMS